MAKKAAAPVDPASRQTEVVITPPNFPVVKFRIRGTADYGQNRWTEKALRQMMETQMSGQRRKKGSAREARDFDAEYESRLYRTADGHYGIPAILFRNAMISACRIVGFKMTHAKLCIFIEADGKDQRDGTPLVFIHGEPVKKIHAVRNATGVADLRARPFFEEWWADLRVKFDGDLFNPQDIANLLQRAGIQCGIGEGRPDSKESAGMGWGTFTIEASDEKEEAKRAA